MSEGGVAGQTDRADPFYDTNSETVLWYTVVWNQLRGL
jgi:hypothetical protein